jgi:peptide/nickel transport system permease protein
MSAVPWATLRLGFTIPTARTSTRLTMGAILSVVIILVALVSLCWTPYPHAEMRMSVRLQGPSAAHWLGTDQFGRDVLSLVMVATQSAIAVGVVAVLIGFLAGTVLGLWSSARAGLVDDAVMRTCDFLFAFPPVLGAIMLSAWLGPGAINSMIAIGIYNIPSFARLVRGAAKPWWLQNFVLAARMAGKRTWRIALEHILPNMLTILVIQATIAFATAILAEAALSYLGLGAQPPQPSWGRMLNEAQVHVARAPHLAIFPGLMIMLTVRALTLLGEGLRDALDPRHRTRAPT